MKSRDLRHFCVRKWQVLARGYILRTEIRMPIWMGREEEQVSEEFILVLLLFLFSYFSQSYDFEYFPIAFDFPMCGLYLKTSSLKLWNIVWEDYWDSLNPVSNIFYIQWLHMNLLSLTSCFFPIGSLNRDLSWGCEAGVKTLWWAEIAKQLALSPSLLPENRSHILVGKRVE